MKLIPGILIFSALMFGTAQAQQAQTKDQLNLYINTYIHTNKVGGITGAIMNTALINMVASMCGLAITADCPLSTTLFSSWLSGLPKCASPCTIPPVATGQPYINSSGFVVIAQ